MKKVVLRNKQIRGGGRQLIQGGDYMYVYVERDRYPCRPAARASPGSSAAARGPCQPDRGGWVMIITIICISVINYRIYYYYYYYYYYYHYY